MIKPTENDFNVGKQGDTEEDCYYREDTHHYITVPKEWTEEQTEEFIKQIIQDKKLRELVERGSKKRSNGCDGSERDCPTCDEINVCRNLLEKSQK